MTGVSAAERRHVTRQVAAVVGFILALQLFAIAVAYTVLAVVSAFGVMAGAFLLGVIARDLSDDGSG